MTKEEYKKIRSQIGTQDTVAVLLGIDEGTLSRRERGDTAISEEAAKALVALRSDFPSTRQKLVKFLYSIAKAQSDGRFKLKYMECAEEIEALESELAERQKKLCAFVDNYAEAKDEKARRLAWEGVLGACVIDGDTVSDAARKMHLGIT